jgi:hypothetical protein
MSESNKCAVCGKECNGNTCSGSCRAKLSRRTRTADLGAQPRRTESSARFTKEPDFNGCPDPIRIGQQDAPTQCVEYANRTNPDSLNHGKPMTMDALKKAGLTANRVPVPGDHDYCGCCEQVEGKW